MRKMSEIFFIGVKNFVSTKENYDRSHLKNYFQGLLPIFSFLAPINEGKLFNFDQFKSNLKINLKKCMFRIPNGTIWTIELNNFEYCLNGSPILANFGIFG